MRRTAPMRWLEEAEARQMRLLDAEARPVAAENSAVPEFVLVRRASLTVLVARMAGRVARAARGRPSADGVEDAPAEGCDEGSIWAEFSHCAPYLVAGTSSAGAAAAAAYGSSYSRETSRPV